MILGIGIDVVHVNRMRKWQRVEGLLQRYFHPDELASVRKRQESLAVLSLAARFAAKEAFGKALGTGLKGLALKEIQVENNYNGKPDIRLFGKAREAFEKIGGKNLLVSLTHEKDNAIAVVIIEG
ncbi:MAG: 4'-phosphopantetheinyl transferase [Spirochaetes bacterium]|nr:MAG: 4'-phosphopantetheinyl transferase [Spirochaetota bacterium]